MDENKYSKLTKAISEVRKLMKKHPEVKAVSCHRDYDWMNKIEVEYDSKFYEDLIVEMTPFEVK